MSDPYLFRPMTAADIAMVGRWQRTPDVLKWWPNPDEDAIDEAYLSDPNMRLWIVAHAGRPFAYIQDYDPHAWPGHHFAHLPAGSRGIDQFIGEPDMLNRGHGPAFIRTHVDRLFAEGAPAIGTDPLPDNARAIRAYEKAGFVRDAVQDTEWGLALLMARRRFA